MDNNVFPNQIPPVQPSQPLGSVPVANEVPAGSFMTQPGMPGQAVSSNTQALRADYVPPKSHGDLIKTIVIIIVSLIAVTFIGLFIWMFYQYNEVNLDVEEKIRVAEIKAADKKASELEKVFAEREKDPYKSFVGPEDYGQLGFKYPKTWSAFIESDASKGGNFTAYFNPGEVNPLSDKEVTALRVSILNKSFDSVNADYQKQMNKKDSDLQSQNIELNGFSVILYSGTIPNTDLSGYIAIFKIRDKTAIIRTDSVLFKADFDRILESITFNS